MKSIFLIGDSIRNGVRLQNLPEIGYGYHVAKKLKGKVNVYQSDDNARFAQYTLRYLPEWVRLVPDPAKIDIVYWNNGLWDLLRIDGDEPLTPPEVYRSMLVRVHGRIQKYFPNAKIVFALTTPVREELASPSFNRKNSEIDAYNEIARNALEPLGVTIHDLHTEGEKIQWEHHHDWVHFDATGASILADKVIRFLGL